MNGILLINKEKDLTSRDVVNQISKKLNIKKVGHAGTLDPIATGVLVVGVGKGTKILDLLTLDTKEYIATVQMGIQTDTFDVAGNVLEENNNFLVTKEKLLETLNSFKGSYYQMVPKYSAVKIKGKKLYEYARSDIEVELPSRLVDILDISLLDFDIQKKEFRFRALVSKGTYIRSLINDIGHSLNIPCTMKDLVRTKSGKFKLEDTTNIFNLQDNLISIKDALDFLVVKITDDKLLKKVRNGNKIYLDNYTNDFITIVDNQEVEIAIYQKEKFDVYKAFKVF